MSGVVLTYAAGRAMAAHERATHAAIAKLLAELHGFQFGGEFDPQARYSGRLYFVPSDTLLAADAGALGIQSETDLFGGVVPFEFAATKTIVHPLVAADALAPRGWSTAFTEAVRDVVLPGFSAFSPADVRRAALRLLERGPVRVKRALGIGGRGQHTVNDRSDLEPVIDALDPRELERYGAAVELDLTDTTTYSIGRVLAAGTELAYCGMQRMTTDNRGGSAFGGSDLLVIRGGLEALLDLPLTPPLRRAVEQAQTFDTATRAFRGFFASRRNYDAVCGLDANGRRLCGILEQSWRIGGASGAEIAALQAFARDPALRVVRARTTETYGAATTPPGAIMHFSAVDPQVGPITKYTVVEPYEAAG